MREQRTGGLLAICVPEIEATAAHLESSGRRGPCVGRSSVQGRWFVTLNIQHGRVIAGQVVIPSRSYIRRFGGRYRRAKRVRVDLALSARTRDSRRCRLGIHLISCWRQTECTLWHKHVRRAPKARSAAPGQTKHQTAVAAWTWFDAGFGTRVTSKCSVVALRRSMDGLPG